MKIGHINAKPEQLWHWFKYQTPGDKPCLLELRLITSDEILDVPKDLVDDMKLYRAFVAENWFRDFKGVTDANGNEIPNNLEMRIQVLQHPMVWPWVRIKLAEASDLSAEGKDDSGSAS
jgi:hypothetical protein